MGASNFHRGNTSKVFAVLMNREEKYSKCSECEEKYWEWEGNYVEEGDTVIVSAGIATTSDPSAKRGLTNTMRVVTL